MRQCITEIAELRRLPRILGCSGSNPLNRVYLKTVVHLIVTPNVALQKYEHNQGLCFQCRRLMDQEGSMVVAILGFLAHQS